MVICVTPGANPFLCVITADSIATFSNPALAFPLLRCELLSEIWLKETYSAVSASLLSVHQLSACISSPWLCWCGHSHQQRKLKVLDMQTSLEMIIINSCRIFPPVNPGTHFKPNAAMRMSHLWPQSINQSGGVHDSALTPEAMSRLILLSSNTEHATCQSCIHIHAAFMPDWVHHSNCHSRSRLKD